MSDWGFPGETTRRYEMTNIHEISKVEYIHGLWCVMILSASNGHWICQGEWNTKEEATTDRQNWL